MTINIDQDLSTTHKAIEAIAAEEQSWEAIWTVERQTKSDVVYCIGRTSAETEVELYWIKQREGNFSDRLLAELIDEERTSKTEIDRDEALRLRNAHDVRWNRRQELRRSLLLLFTEGVFDETPEGGLSSACIDNFSDNARVINLDVQPDGTTAIATDTLPDTMAWSRYISWHQYILPTGTSIMKRRVRFADNRTPRGIETPVLKGDMICSQYFVHLARLEKIMLGKSDAQDWEEEW